MAGRIHLFIPQDRVPIWERIPDRERSELIGTLLETWKRKPSLDVARAIDPVAIREGLRVSIYLKGQRKAIVSTIPYGMRSAVIIGLFDRWAASKAGQAALVAWDSQTVEAE